ncbi:MULTISPECIES: hypothetical protein [Acetobacter]|uniref:Protein MobE n=1 Tax=Acetobacter pomorum DM001 TaxID=945681 RepID=F1YSC6_9PROT|nr:MULTISPECIES: hypothetical protein [Acetobacter]ATI12683.1 hypothetical protein CPF11_09625 [Acetobacter pomorum]AXC27182.1 hypothetical protein DS739_10775 [Acetobacter sp. JWB]EGE48259.1 Protein MobE [Acetobacter pomorum DM001]KAA8422510.1 hypothetical protein FKW54_12110 [Acetobacter pomorum]KAA8431232.1 hypothetical protein FKW50_13895 [Acetobacter pomorum]
MTKFETVFQGFYGRNPTDAEIQEHYRIKNAMDIRDNDALWLILIPFQYYTKKLQDIPQAIEVISDEFNQNSRQAMQRYEAKIKSDLNSAVAVAGQDVASTILRRKIQMWSAISITVFALVCVGLVTVLWTGRTQFHDAHYEAGYSAGYNKGSADGQKEGYISGTNAGQKAGYEKGSADARDTNALAMTSWATGDAGQKARQLYEHGLIDPIYVLYQTGDLAKILKCAGSGWRVQNGYCVSSVTTDGGSGTVYDGWRLP